MLQRRRAKRSNAPWIEGEGTNIKMEMEYAAVLNFIQRRNLAFFILADDETEEERLADSIFADYR